MHAFIVKINETPLKNNFNNFMRNTLLIVFKSVLTNLPHFK